MLTINRTNDIMKLSENFSIAEVEILIKNVSKPKILKIFINLTVCSSQMHAQDWMTVVRVPRTSFCVLLCLLGPFGQT